jgi:hypothetical protein
MRLRHAAAAAALLAAAGAAVALASHPKVDPATVPVGFFTAHSQMNNIPVATLDKLLKDGKADAFSRHLRLAPGESTGFIKHPGPVFVMVAKGNVTNKEPSGTDCKSKTYVQDRGFVTRGGSRTPHQMTAGTEGAELYMFYLAPRRTGPTDIPVSAPSACA